MFVVCAAYTCFTPDCPLEQGRRRLFKSSVVFLKKARRFFQKQPPFKQKPAPTESNVHSGLAHTSFLKLQA
jgi:hypothetical protein